jgi:hypothetical protein
MDDDVAVFDREVDAMVARTAAVEFFAAGTLNGSEALAEDGVVDVRWLDVQGFQKLELNLSREAGELSGADVVEDDLEH